MTQPSISLLRSRRIRNALLAGVFTVGVAGAAGTGMFLTDNHVALAEPVQVEQAQVPADFTTVVEKVKPAVVSVQVKTQVADVANRGFEFDFDDDDLPPGFEEFFRRFGTPRGFGDDDDNGRGPYHPRNGMSQGSGFFISEDGYLVTNSHVVKDGEEYTVMMDDGSELDAELIGVDERTDLALLKVDGNDFTYATFAKEPAKVGQWVLAIGNPFGLGGSVSAGIISADGRDIGSGPYDDFLQIDAPVNRGNSGGPAFNTRGEVVGVNTAIFSPSGGNVGIAFAIPATMVEEVVSDLKDDGVVTRGWLGVQIQPVTEDIAESLGIESTEGAIVADVMEDAPATGAGIQAGDVITKVNGEIVKDPRSLSETIARIEPDQTITVTVLREGKEREFKVKLGNLNDFDEQQQANADQDNDDQPAEVMPGSLDALGLTVEPNSDGEGVVVVGVEDDSPAAEKGLQAGDVIVTVGGENVGSVSDVEDGINAAQKSGRDAVLFRVQREDGSRFIGVPFERG
jgi:serine protease Do